MSPPDMEWVDSSNIEAIGYDDNMRELFVQFKGGTTYIYVDVPAEVHQELRQADSKGIYLNREIRNSYEWRQA